MNDPYNGNFIDKDKMTDITRDILANIEKWKLTTTEALLIISEVEKYIKGVDVTKNIKSRIMSLNTVLKGDKNR